MSTFQLYTPDEKHQQTTYRKPIPRNRLVTSQIVAPSIGQNYFRSQFAKVKIA
jgi:hypothetical protein